MTTRFMVPPSWPAPPKGWVPPEGWEAPAEWSPAPVGWQFWYEDGQGALRDGGFAATSRSWDQNGGFAATGGSWDGIARHGAAVAPAAPAAPVTRSLPRTWWRRLSWVAVLVGGLISYAVVYQTMLDTQNVLFFPTLLLIGSVTVPAAVLLLEYAIGVGLDGRGTLIIGAAVVAGIVGVTLAGAIENSLTGTESQVYLGVAVIEEIAKMLVPLAIFVVARRRTAGMGLALGIAAGAGFAVLETMGYAFYALVARGGGLAAMQETLQLRALLAPASHVAWTGMVAWALWRIGALPRRRFAVTGLTATFAAAVGLHYLWDQTNDLTTHIAIAVISVAVLVTLMVRSALRDAARTQTTGPTSGPSAGALLPPLVQTHPVSAPRVEHWQPPVGAPDRQAA